MHLLSARCACALLIQALFFCQGKALPPCPDTRGSWKLWLQVSHKLPAALPTTLPPAGTWAAAMLLLIIKSCVSVVGCYTLSITKENVIMSASNEAYAVYIYICVILQTVLLHSNSHSYPSSKKYWINAWRKKVTFPADKPSGCPIVRLRSSTHAMMSLPGRVLSCFWSLLTKLAEDAAFLVWFIIIMSCVHKESIPYRHTLVITHVGFF